MVTRKKVKAQNFITAFSETSDHSSWSREESDKGDCKVLFAIFWIYQELGYLARYIDKEPNKHKGDEGKLQRSIGYRSRYWQACKPYHMCVGIKEDDKDRRVSESVWWTAKPPSKGTLICIFLEEIGDSTGLKVLELNYNNMESLSCSIGNLAILKELSLQYTWKLFHLPEKIWKFD